MADLPDNLQAHVQALVKLQQSGQYEPRMGYKPSQGLHIVLRSAEGGDETTACEGITRQDLQKLRGAGLIRVNTPRAAWTIHLRPAAYEL